MFYEYHLIDGRRILCSISDSISFSAFDKMNSLCVHRLTVNFYPLFFFWESVNLSPRNVFCKNWKIFCFEFLCNIKLKYIYMIKSINSNKNRIIWIKQRVFTMWLQHWKKWKKDRIFLCFWCTEGFGHSLYTVFPAIYKHYRHAWHLIRRNVEK